MLRKSGYLNAFKATSLFGGVQVFRLLSNMIRFKLIAVILGPSGFGLISIFNSVLNFVVYTSNMGISSSAIKEISSVNATDDNEKKNNVVTAIYRWIFATGILGALIMILLSSKISLWSLQNYSYTKSFLLLSIAAFFMIINSGELAILQGYRELKSLAIANVFGAFIGLVISVPMYYLWGINGIVPSLILSAFLLFLLSHYYVRKVKIDYSKQTIKETINIGKGTLYLGIMMSVSSMAAYLFEVCIKSYISKNGGTIDVGLYQAGWTINTSYIGIVLTAMATDYFPRLTSVSENKVETKKVITEQTEITILLLTPLVAIMLSFLPFFVKLLYTNEFLSIITMTSIMLIGSFYKISTVAINYLFLAKGDGKIFMWNEIIISVVSLFTCMVGYHYYKLIGIGIAYTINYIIYFILVIYLANKKYGFSFEKNYWKIFLKYSVIIFLIFIIGLLLGYTNLSYMIFSIFILVLSVFIYKDFNKRIDLKEIVLKFYRKNK